MVTISTEALWWVAIMASGGWFLTTGLLVLIALLLGRRILKRLDDISAQATTDRAQHVRVEHCFSLRHDMADESNAITNDLSRRLAAVEGGGE